MIEGRFAELIAGQRQGVLVTLRKDGRPQLSNVNYAWYPEEQTIRVSTTDDRAKTGNMRRDPRVSFHVTSDDFWSYAAVDGRAELSAVAGGTVTAVARPARRATAAALDRTREVRTSHPIGAGRPVKMRTRTFLVPRVTRAINTVIGGFSSEPASPDRRRTGCRVGRNIAPRLVVLGA